MENPPAGQTDSPASTDTYETGRSEIFDIRTRSRASRRSLGNIDVASISSETMADLESSLCGENVEAMTTEELAVIIGKKARDRDENENRILAEWSFMIPQTMRFIKSRAARAAAKLRNTEHEEPLEDARAKSKQLAEMILQSKHTVIYTGAGISTSASIPDYRGPNGLWTQRKKVGTYSITRDYDLTNADPTITHMAIRELCSRRLVRHVVSQNCDGLHLRSGVPIKHLSDIHGNMYIEACPVCEKQYYREADVTVKTSRFKHKTGRKCHSCRGPNNELIDTIVLYGEKSRTNYPMNWERAAKAAKKADLIICIGSSLRTLVRYGCLWPKTLRGNNGKEATTKLVIINLQGTPKDRMAALKINAKCDLVMQIVMQQLELPIPAYDRIEDPLRELAIPFKPEELGPLRRNLLFASRQSAGSDEATNTISSGSSESNNDGNGRGTDIENVIIATDESPTEQSNLDAQRPSDQTSSSGDANPPARVDYALPGWLTKVVRNTKTSSYKRKRHGNKGRKRSKPQPPTAIQAVEIEVEPCTSTPSFTLDHQPPSETTCPSN